MSEKLDIGFRLAPVPLPFSTVGPGFGANIDFKYMLTSPENKVQLAAIIGAGGAHVLIRDNNRFAYSPNAALLATFGMNETTDFTVMGRHVHHAIPTATDGAKGNFVNISGVSFGLRKSINQAISILPEVGAY